MLSVNLKKLPVLWRPGASARLSSLTAPVETSAAPWEAAKNRRAGIQCRLCPCCSDHPLHRQKLCHKAIELVKDLRRVECPAAFGGAERSGNDLLGVAVGERVEGFGVAGDAGDVQKFGLHRSRTNGGDRNAFGTQFVGQTAGERRNIGLASRIDRHAGIRTEGSDRRDIENVTAGRHVWQNRIGHQRQRADIEVAHPRLRVIGNLAEVSKCATAGVVDQKADARVLLSQIVGKGLEAARVAEVKTETDNLLVRDGLREIFELADATRDEPERVNLGELRRNLV